MKMRMFLSSLMLASALLTMGGCSDNGMEMPTNPETPVAGDTASTMVIYEANPRFFATDGCLAAINDRMDEIEAMGANVLWIMPIYTPGELNSVGSPYCIKDYTSINPRYGTLADLQTLVGNAHQRGMKVILDWVANHTSWDHAWITAHADWYTQDENGNIISPEGQNWTDVADLNYDNAEMRAAMIDAMEYWVNTADIDGFRCDYTDGVPHDFWADAIAQLRTIDSELIMLSESEGSDYFADGFDMVYDWSYATLLANLFNGQTTPENFFDDASELLTSVPDGKQVMRYAVNHDVAMSNDLATLYGSIDAIEPAYVLTTMLDGVPLLYSSMETVLGGGSLSFFDYIPLVWNSDREAVYAQINEVYASTAEVRGGELRTYSTGDVATFARFTPDHTLLVMVNTSGNAASAKVPISLAGTQMQDMLGGTTATMPVSIDLAGYGYAIYYK